MYNEAVRKFIKIFAIVAAVVLISVAFWWLRSRSNPLERYGVSYDKSYGEHESFQHIQFYLKKNQRRIEGPEITGDELYVEYDRPKNRDIPDIVVRSRVYTRAFVVVRLNLADKNRPEFEIVKNQMMTINYLPLGYHWP